MYIATIRHFINSIRHFNGVIEVSEVNSAVNLSLINIDTQINFSANKLRLPQLGSFYFINNSRNTASSMLDQVHIRKRMGKAGNSGNTDIHTAISAKDFDIIIVTPRSQ